MATVKGKTAAKGTAKGPEVAVKAITPMAKTMTEEEKKEQIEKFREMTLERARKQVAARVEKFEEQLSDKESNQFEILVRKSKLFELKSRMSELRASSKKLRAEIKELKAEARKSASEKAKAKVASS